MTDNASSNSPAGYLTDLFGLSGQTAVVIGGAGVLGAGFAADCSGPARMSSSPI